MFKFVTTKSITAIAVAALVASLAALLTSIGPEAKAESPAKAAQHQAYGKGDRLPAHSKGAACSTRGWPHYEPKCQFDLRQPGNVARTVRIIALR